VHEGDVLAGFRDTNTTVPESCAFGIHAVNMFKHRSIGAGKELLLGGAPFSTQEYITRLLSPGGKGAAARGQGGRPKGSHGGGLTQPGVAALQGSSSSSSSSNGVVSKASRPGGVGVSKALKSGE
jgi:hypothetical protein